MIVGIMGAAGSGKTTAASHIVARYGAVSYSFAGPLKNMARAIWGFSESQLYGTQADKEAVDPRWNMSPRVALQRLGTDACRQYLGSDVWLRACLGQIHRDAPKLAVIEDVRFADEAAAVIESGGVVLRIDCPDRVSAADEDHPSECGWRTAPYTRAVSVTRAQGAAELLRQLDQHLAELLKDEP